MPEAKDIISYYECFVVVHFYWLLIVLGTNLFKLSEGTFRAIESPILVWFFLCFDKDTTAYEFFGGAFGRIVVLHKVCDYDAECF